MSLSQITCRLKVACDISVRKRRWLRCRQELRRRRTPSRSVTTDLAAVCDIRSGAWSFAWTVFGEALRVGDSVPSLVSARRLSSGLLFRGAGGFAVHPVMEDEEGQPED